MLRAYYLYTGHDGHSHVVRGSVVDHEVSAARSVMWAESPPHSSLDWHNAPTNQYVITLAGELEFVTQADETFTIHPGEILVAMDTTGSGHKWRLVNDQPWQRAYVVFDEQNKFNFQPDEAPRPAAACS